MFSFGLSFGLVTKTGLHIQGVTTMCASMVLCDKMSKAEDMGLIVSRVIK